MEFIWTVTNIVIAATVGAIAAWAREAVVRYSRRAILEINGCDYHDDGTWREHYIIVRNRGKTTARTCVGQITVAPRNPFQVKPGGIVTEDSIRSHSSASLNDIGLFWYRADKPLEIAIHPEQAQRLVIGRSRSRSSVGNVDFTIPTGLGYEPPQVVFSGPGYEFIARIGSDNAKPTLAFGQILWSELNPAMELSEEVTSAFRISNVSKMRWKRLRKRKH